MLPAARHLRTEQVLCPRYHGASVSLYVFERLFLLRCARSSFPLPSRLPFWVGLSFPWHCEFWLVLPLTNSLVGLDSRFVLLVRRLSFWEPALVSFLGLVHCFLSIHYLALILFARSSRRCSICLFVEPSLDVSAQ